MNLNAQQIQPAISKCRVILNNIGKISPEKINNLSKELKQSIRDCTPARLKELAKMNCLAAEKIKRELDKQYGKNHYVIISIGRSLSSIAEQLGYMGVDTKIIPLSGLRTHDVSNINSEKLHIYKTFLVQIGLSKTDLQQNKNKAFIIMDYTKFGRSLKRAEQLLKKDELLGNAPNLISLPVSKVLGEDYEKRGFKQLFDYCRFKDYSYVGRLLVNNLNDVYHQCSPDRVKEYNGNITKGIRQLFWFNVFDSYIENKYRDTMPTRELNSIYEHYLSPKAIRNYLNQELKKTRKNY